MKKNVRIQIRGIYGYCNGRLDGILIHEPYDFWKIECRKNPKDLNVFQRMFNSWEPLLHFSNILLKFEQKVVRSKEEFNSLKDKIKTVKDLNSYYEKEYAKQRQYEIEKKNRTRTLY